MESLEQLRKVAIYCSQYTKDIYRENTLKSSSELERKSCTNCTHFKNKSYCELNLIDKVLSTLSMENDLKS